MGVSKKHMIRNLILDYNGVISNDFELVYKASMTMFDRYCLARMTYAEFRNKFKIPVSLFWGELLPNIDPHELDQLYFNVYSSLGAPSLYEKADEVLYRINKMGCRMIILSSHKKSFLLRELAIFGINTSIFESIYGDVKNKIEVIDKIVIEHGYDLSTTAYVGDTEHDIYAAKKAGMISIASTYGYRTKKQLTKSLPDYYIKNISALLKLL